MKTDMKFQLSGIKVLIVLYFLGTVRGYDSSNIYYSNGFCPKTVAKGCCLYEEYPPATVVECPTQNPRFRVVAGFEGRLFLKCFSEVQYEEIARNISFTDLIRKYGTHVIISDCPPPNISITRFLKIDNVNRISHIDLRHVKGNLTDFDFSTIGQIENVTLSVDPDNNFLAVPGTSGIQSHVRFLNLAGNRNFILQNDSFHGFGESLQILNISNNGLESLASNQFENLTELQTLDISNNRIKNLPNDVFKNLEKLSILKIENNLLTTLSDQIFGPVEGLRKIYFGGNMFVNLNGSLFDKNSNLLEIYLHGNGCRSPDRKCKNQTSRISIHESMFQIPSLRKLEITDFPLKNLSVDQFKGAKNLESLIIRNSLNESHLKDILGDCENLKHLTLSGNNISYIEDGFFGSLTELESLDLSYNKIQYIQRASIYPSKWRNISYKENEADWIGNLNKLRELNLEGNLVSCILDIELGKMSMLKKANFRHNNFTIFTADDVKKWSLMKDPGLLFDFSFNKINKTDMVTNDVFSWSGYFYSLLFGRKNLNVRVILTDNPLHLSCDCSSANLDGYNKAVTYMKMGNAFNFVVPNNMECSSDSLLDTSSKKVLYRKDLNLVCYLAPVGSLIDCPDKCRCYWEQERDLSSGHITVNCSHQHLQEFPQVLPSYYRYGKKLSFVLDMSNNRLSEMPSRDLRIFRFWDHEIKSLQLSENRIKNVTLDLGLLNNLEMLDLSYNDIEYFDEQQIRSLKKLARNGTILALGENPYLCECKSKPFYDFVFEYHKTGKVIDVANITVKCRNSTISIMRFDDKYQEMCKSSVTSRELVLVSFLGISTLLTLLLCIIIYYHKEILVLLHDKNICRFVCPEESLEKDQYDAFISYSHHDRDYVNQILLPELQNAENEKHRYKCLTHEKDWLIGEPIINNIHKSIKSARRVIIVWSKNSSKSEWMEKEFQAAIYFKKRMIFVLLDQLTLLQNETESNIKADLDGESDTESDIVKYMKRNTWIDHDNPWFWMRLRCNLPHKHNLWNLPKEKVTQKEELELTK